MSKNIPRKFDITSENIIDVQNIFYSYDEDEATDAATSEVDYAIEDVSLKVKPGEYIAILGHNGSGKSTLAKMLNMILTPIGGNIYVGGLDITSDDITEDEMIDVRRNVGMVFQNPDNQLVATVVEEDVAFGPENLGVPPSEIRRRVDSALDTVGMKKYAKHAPHRLSGGQKQRIAIAGVLAMRPKCIILDESTAMLDPLGRREVMDTIERLNRENEITILHITHYMEEAARADRIVVINDGRIAMDGTPREVFSQIEELREVGLEAPQACELANELRKSGLDIPDGIITAEECIDAVANLLK